MQAEFESVLIAAQAGADWAWSRIYDDLGRTITGYFRSQGVSDPEALTNDTFLRLAGGIDGFSGTYDKFRSWVFAVAHNLLIDERRRRSRRVHEVSAEAAPEPRGGDVEAEAFDSLGTDWVAQALDILTDEQREIIGLRILAGFTIGQIAEVTGKRPGAVKASQRRALRRISDWHARNPYPDDHGERLPE